MSLLLLLAQYDYRPFITPPPIWDNPYWSFLAIPLCAAIAIVYKCVRCDSMKSVPREAAILFAFIIAVMALTAGGLAAIVKIIG